MNLNTVLDVLTKYFARVSGWNNPPLSKMMVQVCNSHAWIAFSKGINVCFITGSSTTSKTFNAN